MSDWMREIGLRPAALVRRLMPPPAEPARSWFGGRPRFPTGIPWPVSATGITLPFLAQIACADLPGAIWGGMGPRTGWLLFFAGVRDGSPRGAVIHVNDLGPERKHPDRQPTEEGFTFNSAPFSKRPWPVEIVPFARQEELDAVVEAARAECKALEDRLLAAAMASTEPRIPWREMDARIADATNSLLATGVPPDDMPAALRHRCGSAWSPAQRHQIGGSPQWVQGPGFYEKLFEWDPFLPGDVDDSSYVEPQLLLQLWGDGSRGWALGGMIAFGIYPPALQQGDFSQVIVITQSD